MPRLEQILHHHGQLHGRQGRLNMDLYANWYGFSGMMPQPLIEIFESGWKECGRFTQRPDCIPLQATV